MEYYAVVKKDASCISSHEGCSHTVRTDSEAVAVVGCPAELPALVGTLRSVLLGTVCEHLRCDQCKRETGFSVLISSNFSCLIWLLAALMDRFVV